MDSLSILIKEGYSRFRSTLGGGPPKRISEEDIACFNEGILGESDRTRVLNHMLARDEEESLRSLVLASALPEGETPGPPEEVVENVKALSPKSIIDEALTAVIEFADGLARVIATTGSVITCAGKGELLPAGVFRNTDEKAKSSVIELSKIAGQIIVNIRITRIAADIIDLVVHLKDRKSQTPLSGERVSLSCDNRELRSSLTADGKVEYENLRVRNYELNLVRKGETRCIASLSLKALEG